MTFHHVVIDVIRIEIEMLVLVRRSREELVEPSGPKAQPPEMVPVKRGLSMLLARYCGCYGSCTLCFLVLVVLSLEYPTPNKIHIVLLEGNVCNQ